jgi:N-acetyl sugar amidotransferase
VKNRIVDGMEDEIKRCSRCVLPASYPFLSFDGEGVCSKCREHRGFSPMHFKQSEKKLKEIFGRVKKRNNTYDCIIGLSGGKDSSYVALLAVEKYKLNPLCVTFNNGFVSDLATENIQKVIGYLDVDHLVFKPSWELMKRLYRLFLTKTGSFCTPCDIGINSLLYSAAKTYRVPMIISGYSAYTDASTDINIYHISSDYFSRVARDAFTPTELRDFFHATTFTRARYHLTRRIRYIWIPSYLRWDEDKITEVLHQTMGWKVPNSVTVEHTDCIASVFKEYLRIKEFGFSEKAMKFSTQVRNGFVTRERALEKVIDFENYILQRSAEIIRTFTTKLDISENDLKNALKMRQGPYISRSARIFEKLKQNEFVMRRIVH